MCHKVSKVVLPYQQGTHSILLYVLYLSNPQVPNLPSPLDLKLGP